MTFNDFRFSTFWSSGDDPQKPPSGSTLQVGKHIGANRDFGGDATDPATWRNTETIGYIVIDGGHGTIDGRGFVAGVGDASIAGVHGNSPYSYPLESTTIQFSFNEPYDPTTLSREDLVVSEGHVTSAHAIDSETAAFTIVGVHSDAALTLELPFAALADPLGAPMARFIGDYTVDRAGVFPTPIQPQPASHAGSLVYDHLESAFDQLPRRHRSLRD